MDRQEAIHLIVSDSSAACHEFCCRNNCTCTEDTEEALRTLGVTQAELDA